MGQGKKYAIIGGIIAAVIIAAAAVSLSFSAQKGTSLTVASESAGAEGLQLGNNAPDFSLTDPQKGTITKQTFGGRPLFIFFTTTYCTPCQIGAENLARYDDESRGNVFNVLIVFVDPRETDSQFIDWKKKYGREDWYVAIGEEMAVNYEVRYLDTKYVFDKDGIIRWNDIEPLQYSSIQPVLGPLL